MATSAKDGMRQFANAPADLNFLVESARKHGDKIFLVEGGRRVTFNELFSLRDALVTKLAIKRGDRVAICMRNRTEWMTGFLATVRAGGIAALPDILCSKPKSAERYRSMRVWRQLRLNSSACCTPTRFRQAIWSP